VSMRLEVESVGRNLRKENFSDAITRPRGPSALIMIIPERSVTPDRRPVGRHFIWVSRFCASILNCSCATRATSPKVLHQPTNPTE